MAPVRRPYKLNRLFSERFPGPARGRQPRLTAGDQSEKGRFCFPQGGHVPDDNHELALSPRGRISTYNKRNRSLIFNKYGGRCAYCGVELDSFDRLWHFEHSVPTAHGGKSDYDNIMPSCHGCNSWKSRNDIEGFRVLITNRLLRFAEDTIKYSGLLARFNIPIPPSLDQAIEDVEAAIALGVRFYFEMEESCPQPQP